MIRNELRLSFSDLQVGFRRVACPFNFVQGKVGKKLKWDPERFKNCDKGNKLLSRARRKGYELTT
ncbi:MAG: hypothetical protein JSW59_01170 [Phycisphaerales bacterium]|nr:MAG: hypothetical protein JSW59_01170 [Phycisphaerales bacterium]